MSLAIKDDEINIVLGAVHPDLKEELKIPEGFNLDVYKKPDIDRVVGSSTSVLFSGYACRYFGYLVSRKKYIISMDDDCLPARDPKGADFVRGYPFSLRSGVKCALSCGLWLNLADHDAPTQALKAKQKNSRYVDAVMTRVSNRGRGRVFGYFGFTVIAAVAGAIAAVADAIAAVAAGSLVSISGINIAFDREVVGPALVPALKLGGEGKFRWETMEDIWSGLCIKVVCDHLGLGVKTGLPYMWRTDRGDPIASLKKEWEGVKLMEELVPFFQSVRLPREATTVKDCVVEVANAAKERLGSTDPVFARAAKAMLNWVNLWKSVGSI
ncbi:putative UDP-arabinopyranose mutase 5 [Hibiscus syriacus]|uniref:UDP-arabinopyranose mutase 5 n=1 Tax=Hibiscus syriacus TaxID=106335 RepID=A0A6A2X7Q4_HIBSY|nr:putative UDP-arabinopyranose mutase 5 [Hibiscus syriacus]